MASPTPSWNTVRHFGTWVNQDGTKKTGTYRVTMPVRVTNATDDVIIPAGVFASGSLSLVNGQPSLDVQIPAGNDSDNSPSGFQPILTVTFADGAASETYALTAPVSLAGDATGVDLASIVLPVTLPATTPVLIRGVSGGVAALDSSGNVIDAFGNVLSATGNVPATNVRTGTAYTLVLADANTVLETSSSSAVTITVPTNATAAFPVGTVVELCQVGTGTVTLNGASGAVIRTASTLASRAQWSTLALRKRATNEWVLSGDTA